LNKSLLAWVAVMHRVGFVTFQPRRFTKAALQIHVNLLRGVFLVLLVDYYAYVPSSISGIFGHRRSTPNVQIDS